MQLLEELDRLGVPKEKIHRVQAIPTPGFGMLGCGLSHKKALETFVASGQDIALILEDDIKWTLDIHYCRFLFKTLFEDKVPFDIVMLAGNILKEEPGPQPYLRKVLDGQTASAFFITREFAPKLIACLDESTRLLEDWHKKYNERKHEYCNDQYWKCLQPQNRWYIFHPKLGLQRESYSDNELCVTNYGV